MHGFTYSLIIEHVQTVMSMTNDDCCKHLNFIDYVEDKAHYLQEASECILPKVKSTNMFCTVYCVLNLVRLFWGFFFLFFMLRVDLIWEFKCTYPIVLIHKYIHLLKLDLSWALLHFNKCNNTIERYITKIR